MNRSDFYFLDFFLLKTVRAFYDLLIPCVAIIISTGKMSKKNRLGMRRNDNFNLCGYQKTLFFVRFFDFLYIIFYFLKFVVSLHSVI